MRKDLMAVIQKENSPLCGLVANALTQTGHRPKYRSYPIESPIPPEDAPPLMIWDLWGFTNSQKLSLAHNLQYEHSGLVVVCTKSTPLDHELLGRCGALAFAASPRNIEALSVIIQIALGNYWRLIRLQESLGRSIDDLQDRDDIERAKRIVMRQKQCSESYAMKRLQAHSRNHNIKLGLLARRVVSGYERINGT